MLSDMNCVYDLLSATFAEGLRVNELSLPQVLIVLKKVQDFMDETKFESHLLCGVKVTHKILLVWKERVLNQLKVVAAAGTDGEALHNL